MAKRNKTMQRSDTQPASMEKIAALEAQVRQLTQQVDWFKRQLFGQKSERRVLAPHPQQPLLNGFESLPQSSVDEPKETISYQRRKGKQRDSDCVTDKGLRFDDSVPIQAIHLSLHTGLRLPLFD